MPPIELTVAVERWATAGAFTIARGSRREVVVVVATLTAGGVEGSVQGRGECVPYARYGETVEGVVDAIESQRERLRSGLDRSALQAALPAGAARNALDCALWDLKAKLSGQPAHSLAGLPGLRTLNTAYTLSLAEPEAMAAAAAAAVAAGRPLLKIKLGGADDIARLVAVRRAAPSAELIVDANEGWRPADLSANLAACAEAGVTLVEQPLPAADDAALATIRRPVAVCADESLHDRASLPKLAGRYDAINIKLDKAGGLTEALALADAAERAGLRIMVGCMLATSLAMAPALIVAQRASVVDLDGPLLLASDRPHGLRYEGGLVHPPDRELWG